MSGVAFEQRSIQVEGNMRVEHLQKGHHGEGHWGGEAFGCGGFQETEEGKFGWNGVGTLKKGLLT